MASVKGTPDPVLDWHQGAMKKGLDGRFEIGVFMVRPRLGKYKLEFFPAEKYRNLVELPDDAKERKRYLEASYDKEYQAVYVAEGMAIAMRERMPKTPQRGTGDNIVDSIEALLRDSKGGMSKAEILARLHFTEAQWARFQEARPKSIVLESHGRGARYFYKGVPTKPPHPAGSPVDSFDSYVGQSAVVGRMRKYIESAKARKAPLDHVLLYGPPGVGKTTLAKLIATELKRPFHVFWGPTLEVAEIKASPNDIVFIDEIHAMSPTSQEELFDIMGAGVTIIGATNYPGRLTTALRDRFGIKEPLDMHTPEDLQVLIEKVAAREKTTLAPAVAAAIAQRSRGSAREAIALLHRVRDLGGTTPEGVKAAFAQLEIDDLGLTKSDRRYLSILEAAEDAVGVDTLATRLGDSAENLETAVEPFLIQVGLIERTRAGRRITEAGSKHLAAVERRERRARQAAEKPRAEGEAPPTKKPEPRPEPEPEPAPEPAPERQSEPGAEPKSEVEAEAEPEAEPEPKPKPDKPSKPRRSRQGEMDFGS